MGDNIRDEALRSLVGEFHSTEVLMQEFRDYLDRKQRWRRGERELSYREFARQATLERVLREAFYALGGRARDLLPVIRRLQEECRKALSRTPPGRQVIHRLAGKLPGLVIGTVNFDRLIEDGLSGAHQTLVTTEDFAEHRGIITDRLRNGGGPVPILKLHGDIERPESLVADIDTTELGLPSAVAEALDAALGAVDGALTWVWVGCSMRDADLNLWLRNRDGVEELNEWWVDPLPSESLFDYAHSVREPDWARIRHHLHDRLVTETADVFLERLEEHVDLLREGPH